MKKITILTLAFFFTWHSAYCQKTASDYIAKQLENTRLGDSCFSGFYFIKFSIGKNNKAKDIQFSSAMPIILQTQIKQRIDSSLLFFERSFLASAIKKNNFPSTFFLQGAGAAGVDRGCYAQRARGRECVRYR